MEQYATLVMKRKQDGSLVEFCFVIAGAINHLLKRINKPCQQTTAKTDSYRKVLPS